MKKVIKEQDYSKLSGKVANLYSDPENKQFTGQLKIDSVSPTKGSSDKGNWLGNAILDIDGMIKDPISKNVRIKLTFVCGTLPFPDTKNLKPGLYIGPKQIFSINLENELKKFCTVSKGGAAVPKADFVSADVTVDEPMTEGKRVIRLTESELVSLVKKVLNEQATASTSNIANAQKKALVNSKVSFVKRAYCDTVYGVITNGPYKDKSFCDIYNRMIELDPDVDWGEGGLQGNCSDKVVFTTPKLQSNPGWDEMYKYFQSGKDGFTIDSPMDQLLCGDFYYFYVKNSEGRTYGLKGNGKLSTYANENSREVKGTWKFENGKPIFNTPLTKKAVGYAETEEDITKGNKILWKGSRNDLVKRVQFEIMFTTDGKVNPGCKKDTDGNFKPATCDGIFGPNTLKGVQKFQIDNGLKDKSGIVGAETWSAMEPYEIDHEGDSFEE